MRTTRFCVAALLSLLVGLANATVFTFNTDPFSGSDALTTAGRQVVGGEPSITFNIATDVFAFDPAIFGTLYGVADQVLFVNDLSSNLPSSDVNVIVLQDNTVPFAAGLAANAIADEITTAGAGFFIYFNSNLDLPRLVFSTDLNDNTADLKVLARMTNLTGISGRDALPTFTASNFVFQQTVPEPATLALLGLGLLGLGFARRRKK